MNDDNTFHALLLAWILYSVATESWMRKSAVGIAAVISVSVIVKFFI